jgi:uncharacterized protein
MSRKKPRLQVVAGRRVAAPAGKPAARGIRNAAASGGSASAASPLVSGRWLLLALAGALAAAALCVWLVLCLLYWQGSWQLLYHPSSAITRTPASAGLAFDSIGFATTPAGIARLRGWWIPAAPGTPQSRYTVLYLHDKDGNLSGTVDQLVQLHAAGVNVFAFDYRGYGQSQFAHPSEKRWLEDAEQALAYLINTRHIDPHSLVLDGRGLGADLAVELAAAHPELAGVVADSPLEDAASALFEDARAHLVPAHLLASDRWDLSSAAADLRMPSLWFLPFPEQPKSGAPAENPPFFGKVKGPKMFVWLPPGQATTISFPAEFSRWLDSLEAPTPPSAAPAPAQPQIRKRARRASHRHRAKTANLQSR